MNLRSKKSVTLLELLIAITLMGLVILAFSSIDLFSRYHVITADRRAKLQNEASLVVDHITKTVMQASGDINNNGIRACTNGFAARIDAHNTPSDYSDDHWMGYERSGNILRYCGDLSVGFPNCDCQTSPFWQNLSNHILNDPQGFVYNFLENNTGVDVTVRARWNTDPAFAVSPDNPEVVLNSHIYSHSASSH